MTSITYRFLTCAFLCLLLTACKTEPEKAATQQALPDNAAIINDLNRGLTKVVSEDLFPPPVAARIYAYSNIAAYEAICIADDKYTSLQKQFNNYGTVEPPASDMSYIMAMITSYTEVASHCVYREFLVDSLRNQMIRKYVKGEDQKRIEAGQNWGQRLAKHIIGWANADGYNDTRNMPKYQPLNEEDKWAPTQPMYGEALEPHWFRLRPFTMDSSSQFRLELPVEFSKEKNSAFYKSTMKVYEMVRQSNDDAMNVALYWDCNPGPTLVDGHVMKVRKQNTPGGHWMGIHSILATQNKASLIEATRTSAQLMAGISDAFIAAWDTKFHYQLLRPETYINRYIDPDWKPKLESPLFPEFASAHSAVSGVAAAILTAAYGKQSFYDDTNVSFNLPAKKFDDVWQAAEEAAKSRLLGGIHYEFGCNAGLEQGRDLGAYLVQKFELSNQN